MEDLANKEIGKSVQPGTEAVTQGCLDQKHAVLLLICVALEGYHIGSRATQVNELAMEDLVIKEIGDSLQTGTEAVTQCCLNQKHAVLSHICAALGGFIVGFLASKVLDWISPDPGRGKTSIHHVHDHHHYHQQRSPHLDPLYGKVIG